MQQRLYVYLVSAILSCSLVNPLPIEKKDEAKVEITKYKYNNEGNGTYYFHYETSDGTSREENASTLKKSTGEEVLVVRGSYSYTGDDGVRYEVKYIADENGFRPEGEHLNTGFRPALAPVPEDMDVVVVIDQRIDPKLVGTLLGGGIG